MPTGTLTIDLSAIVRNWRALDAMTKVETAAVVKADGYGLGAARVARALAGAGARVFFVAIAEEGAALRRALGEGPEIMIGSGHMAGDARLLKEAALTPLLNAPEQFERHIAALPGHPFGLQFDTGMNRLGLEPDDWGAIRGAALAEGPRIAISHLACADDPSHPMNSAQLSMFKQMIADTNIPASLAATGGTLIGPAHHFDMCRPGIGLYGGLPFADAEPVVRLSLPVIQTRRLSPGESVGYSATFTAERPTVIATVSGGYADGLFRAISGSGVLWAGDIPAPIAGRVSMDLISVDVTDLPEVPDALDVLCPRQTPDDLAAAAGTIGYEILASLGSRHDRIYA